LHAGVTRKRINMLIALELVAGHLVQHWVRPLQKELLAVEEEVLIRRWRLRTVGWNRG
jgi:hypothetical protein